MNLDSLLKTFKSGLTPGNYERFVTLVAGEVTVLLEKAVMKSSFSRLGKYQDINLRLPQGFDKVVLPLMIISRWATI